MPSLKHTHQYVLYKARSKSPRIHDKVFRCAHPHCTHFAPYEVVVGKASICNECGQEFILDRDACLRVKPRCLNCSETKKGKAAQAAKAILGNLEEVLKIGSDGMDEGGFDD